MSQDNFREDFPLLLSDDSIYLDNAATSQKPLCVIEAERDFYLKCNANPLRGFYPLSMEATAMYEEARDKVRGFIGAKSSKEIIFTRNTTESMNFIAYSYGLNNLTEDDEIVVSIMEHHSNMLPWRMVSEHTKAKLKYLKCEKDGSISSQRLDEIITKKTRIFAIGHISNVLGRINPVEYIIKKVHEVGGIVIVDAAQSAPHVAINVQAMGADFLAFSGHKLLGPMGIGVLYGKEELLEKMPPFMFGGEMIESVRLNKVVYAQLPHKFEAGTVNAAGAVALAAAIDYLQKVGYDRISETELRLTTKAVNGLKSIPYVHILGSDDPREHHGIIAFTIEGVHPHDVASILEADGIDVRAGHHCAQPLLEHLGVGSATRASIMFYNTEEEIDAFIESVSSVRRRMGYGK